MSLENPMKKRKKLRKLRLEADKVLKPETEQARMWRRLREVDLSKALKREA